MWICTVENSRESGSSRVRGRTGWCRRIVQESSGRFFRNPGKDKQRWTTGAQARGGKRDCHVIDTELGNWLDSERAREGRIKFNSQVPCRSCLSSSTFPQYVAPSLPSSSENQSADNPEDRILQHFCYFCTMKPGEKNPSASYVRSGKCHKVGLLQLQRFQFVSG